MTTRKVKGYLTIYLSLTLMVMLSLCLTLIDGTRRSSVRLEAECVTDAALYSVMAEYHRELFRQYNLFYIDSSYGGNYPSFYNTQARFQYYLEQNIQEEDSTYIDFVYKDLLGLELMDTVVRRVAFATDDNGKRFQAKAAQVVLQDVGVGLAEDVLGWVGVVENQGMMEYNMEAEIHGVEEKIQSIVEKKATEEGALWVMPDFKSPMEYVSSLIAQGVMQTVLTGEEISNSYVDVTQYVSARRKRGGLNQGNWVEQEVSITERILFHEYMLQYAGYYGQEKQEGLLKYQIEYLLGGQGSDQKNLATVISTLCTIRNAANVIYLYSDSEKKAMAESVATVLATAILVPELAPAFEAALLLGWAYVESLYDVKVLLAGGRVPLMKTDADWHYDLDSVLESADMQVTDTRQQGMSYKDYLHVLLYLTDGEKLTFRFLDIVEMDIRQTVGNEHFRIDGCIECLEVQAVLRSRSGYKHQVSVQAGFD